MVDLECVIMVIFFDKTKKKSLTFCILLKIIKYFKSISIQKIGNTRQQKSFIYP